MKNTDLTELMHAVLDGEATPGEAGELERLLAADPAARTRFDELRRLFDGLAAVPKAFPPEGLVASVMAGLPQQPQRRGRLAQLFPTWGVITATSKAARGSNPGNLATAHNISEQGPSFRGANMSEQQRGSFGKRKVWIGVAAAVRRDRWSEASSSISHPLARTPSGTIVPGAAVSR